MKELRPHQIDDLAFYIANPKCANLSDPGTGKTGSVAVYFQYLWEHHKVKTLWAMPKSLIGKNKKEMHEFTTLTDDQVIIVDGTPTQREKQMKSPNGVVFLMGYQRMADDWAKMQSLHPEIKSVSIDEYHMGGYKNPKSKRAQELFKLGRRIDFFLPMSGTLIDGRLDSCYSAIHVIEPRYYANHYSFMAQHALMDDMGNLIAWINHEKIGRIFLRHCVRRTFAEVYGKEAKVLQKELVPMATVQRKAYKEFEEKAILELEDEFITGDNPAVATMRCRQIMAHPHSMGLMDEKELTGKEEALLVHVEDHLNKKTPFVIFAALQPEQERIAKLCAEWGLRVGLINGNVPSKKRTKIDEDFQAGLLDVVVASPATASVGFNWGHVDHIIFASIDYQNVNFVQAYRRAIRGVREKPLWITVLEYENSIDQRLFAIVDRKSRDLAKVDATYEKLSLSVD